MDTTAPGMGVIEDFHAWGLNFGLLVGQLAIELIKAFFYEKAA